MKKLLLSLVLTMAMSVVLLAGCSKSSGGSGGNSAPSETKAEVAAENAKTEAMQSGNDNSGRQLKVGIAMDITALDPQLSHNNSSVNVYNQIFDTLTIMDQNNEVQPWLAESWEYRDETTVAFKIRDGVKFSDGTDLTAEDVKFTIDRVLASPHVSYVLEFIKKTEVEDGNIVVCYMDEPFAALLAHFSVPYTGIVEKAACEADEEAFHQKPIGSGAYMLNEWKPGESIVLDANPYYWGGDVDVKSVKFIVMPENSQRLMALESGDIDVAYDISPNDVSKVESNDSLVAYTAESAAVYFIAFNEEKETPLKDVNVRLAIDHAINREEIIDAVAYGNGSPANGAAPPTCNGYPKDLEPVSYDLDLAKEYLAKSAYPDGCEFTIVTYDNAILTECANIIQNQLEKIGIKANIDIQEYATVIDGLNDKGYDAFLSRWTTDTADMAYTASAMLVTGKSPYEGNMAIYSDPKCDELVNKAQTNLDPASRVKDYDELFSYVNATAPYTWIYFPHNAAATTKEISGFVINPNHGHQIRLIKWN